MLIPRTARTLCTTGAALVAGTMFGAWVAAVEIADGTHPGWEIALGLAPAACFLVAGAIARVRRPENRVGSLMLAVAAATITEGVLLSPDPRVHTIGLLLRSASVGVAVHLVLAFPDGRVTTAARKIIVGLGYATSFALVPAAGLFTETATGNLLLVTTLSWPDDLVDVTALPVAAAILSCLAAQWWRSSPPMRRIVGPVLVVATAGTAAVFAAALARPVDRGMYHALVAVYQVAACVLPLAFLAGVLRVRLGRTVVSRVVEALGTPMTPAGLERLIADALGDPSLRIGYWLPTENEYVDGDGRAIHAPDGHGSRTSTTVDRAGRPVAVVVHERAAAEDGHVFRAVLSATGLALENHRLTAQVAAQLHEVRSSRARIVAAADRERSRIERDLHDGVQASLVGSLIRLRLAAGDLPGGSGRTTFEEIAHDLEALLHEVREISHGIRPAVLNEAGLATALRALTERVPIPARLDVADLHDPPQTVQVTAYYVVAEGVANVLKHAGASQVTVGVAASDGQLHVQVSDDGCGGAVVGSGLSGVRDRVTALGGSLLLSAGGTRGTTLTARLPLDGTAA